MSEEVTTESPEAREGQGSEEMLDQLTAIYSEIEAIVEARRKQVRPRGIQELLAKKSVAEQWRWLQAHGHEFQGSESDE